MSGDALRSLMLVNSYIDEVQGEINRGFDSLKTEVAPGLIKTDHGVALSYPVGVLNAEVAQGLIKTLELAEKQLENAEKIDPTVVLDGNSITTFKAQVFLQRGLVESYGLGKYSSAIKNIEKSISHLDNFPNSHYMLGLLYADAGKKADALVHLNRAAELDPDNIEFQKVIDYLENTSSVALKTSVAARKVAIFRGSWKILAVPIGLALIGLIMLIQGQATAGTLNILFWGGIAFGYWKWKTS